MNIQRFLLALLATVLSAPAWAQTASKPLDLSLPPSDLPAPASSTAAVKDAPGVYYGDTSGRRANRDAAAALNVCDDATFNEPQVHGTVATGVVSTRHRGSGTWNAAQVHLSKAFGSCAHPGGGFSISVGGSAGHFHGRRD